VEERAVEGDTELISKPFINTIGHAQNVRSYAPFLLWTRICLPHIAQVNAAGGAAMLAELDARIVALEPNSRSCGPDYGTL
jgi:hypothetical protein